MSKHKRDAKRIASWQPHTNRRARRNAARFVLAEAVVFLQTHPFQPLPPHFNGEGL